MTKLVSTVPCFSHSPSASARVVKEAGNGVSTSVAGPTGSIGTYPVP